jgi:6-phosphogluconolactonase
VRTEPIPTDSLADRAALWLADRAWTAIAERGVAHLAVSGGTTPEVMLRALAGLHLPWAAVHVWQVDERIAPDGDADRNAHQLAPLQHAGAHVHLMDVSAHDALVAAAAYADGLHQACAGVLDVVHLGLGDDGHTASWVPGDPVIAVVDRDVARTGVYKGRARLTLTPPAVNRARSIVFLVAGAAKATAVHGLLQGDPSVPATAVRTHDVVLLADPPALGR